ncbi:MAG: DUF1800 domain-containing protein [Acidobacteria bacterium]|nr:DUF1800 domain-containing protein [Acidobacteriota bacterium]
MTEHLFPCAYARAARWLCAAVCLSALAAAASAQTLPAGSPVLLTEGTGQTTRAVAYEAVTGRAEPFPVVSPVNWNADKTNTRDQQTRLMLFAMNLGLLAGEGAGALTADAQDSTGRVYPLKVEALSKPPYDIFDLNGKQHVAQPQDWLWAVTLRLDDQMNDTLGDVLIRISLHGLSSNRVRVAIGQSGAGIAADPSTEFISPAPPTPPAPTPTPTPKAYGAGEASAADVTRLLEQATWGPNNAEIARVQGIGLRAFIDEQFNAPVLNAAKGSDYPDLATAADDSNTTCPTSLDTNTRNTCLRDNYTMYPLQAQFFKNALTRPGQLRQRVAFALHQMWVVSGRDIPLPWWMNGYLQTLDRNAFGNYRTLLGEMTLNPSMGEYLNMNQSVATNFNENYAREVLQLFSIGVNRLKHDGTPITDAQGQPVPAYVQADVDEFTKVFTGWTFNRTPNPALPAGVTNYRDPMVPRGGTTHERSAKNLFGTALTGCPGTNGAANSACAQAELTQALDVIFNHPNVGPFVSRQLIEHLVTSNPSAAYVARVADAFDNDCAGLYPESPCGVVNNGRGNLKAVVRNILLDPEARGDVKTDPAYGKLREPVQYINNFLRAFTATSDGVVAQCTGGNVGDAPNAMGQPLFLPTTVFSYFEPDYQVTGTRLTGPAFQILTTSTTLRRANYVNQMLYFGIQPIFSGGCGNNQAPLGTQIQMAPVINLADNPSGMVDYLNTLLLHGAMSAGMRQTVLNAVNAIPNTSSDYQRRRAQTAIYLVVTSAQYEVQR